MSISMMLGWNVRACSSASNPSLALPTTSIPRAVSKLRSPSLNKAWSSASNTFIAPSLVERRLNNHLRSRPRQRLDGDAPADLFGSFPHDTLTEMASLFGRLRRIKTFAIVGDLNLCKTVLELKINSYMLGTRVFPHIRERLLNDAHELRFYGRVKFKLIHLIGNNQFRSDPAILTKALEIFAQSRDEFLFSRGLGL